MAKPFKFESLAQLSRGTGLTVSYLSRLRNGQRTPSLEVAARIAGYLGITVEELLADLEQRKLPLVTSGH